MSATTIHSTDTTTKARFLAPGTHQRADAKGKGQGALPAKGATKSTKGRATEPAAGVGSGVPAGVGHGVGDVLGREATGKRPTQPRLGLPEERLEARHDRHHRSRQPMSPRKPLQGVLPLSGPWVGPTCGRCVISRGRAGSLMSWLGKEPTCGIPRLDGAANRHQVVRQIAIVCA